MSAPDQPTALSPLKRALLAIDTLEVRLAAQEQARHEPIAVIGIGCRYPGGADDPESFWRLLRDGIEAVREVPPDRWALEGVFDPDPDAPGKTYTRHAGLLDQIDRFDPQFFGISPREAASMDPQQRLLLEVAWEALEHAGQAPDRLSGSATGVFVGVASHDWATLQLRAQDPSRLGAYYGSGIAHSVAAGRISYILGLQGPSIAVDTACSSSLVAVHLACQSLLLDESRMALAGGVNLLLAPDNGISFAKSRMLAPDGRCKAFDDRADGFVDGEGCGVVVLKRLSHALADGDRVLAVIRGTAVNQDGASSGLTAPNGQAQEAVMREALRRAGVAPAEVLYVEAHGTGTSLGDPIEVQALGAALGDGRSPDRPLLIGSLKANIGHAEAAAGVAGLIKVVLALERGELPPQVHFERPSQHIPWATLPVRVVAERMPWPRGRRLAGVSSFGFSGTNAHVVVEEAPAPAPRLDFAERPAHLLVLSARSESALTAVARRLAACLEREPGLDLADVAFTAGTGRAGQAYRAALAATSLPEARQLLGALAGGAQAPAIVRGRLAAPDPPRVAFLFTGQGSQYAGMGRELYDTQPTFRRALDRCAAVLATELDQPLLPLMFGQAGEGALDQTAYTQPALFALEHALSELWRSWGVEPGAVLGHSVGEYAAACTAGALSLEDALRLVAARGRLMQSLPAGGAMAAVFAPEERVAELIAGDPAGLAIAAVNGPAHVVISGDGSAVQRAAAVLAGEGVRVQPLVVSHAFHSPLMEPILGRFAAIAGTPTPVRPRIEWLSNLTGRAVRGAEEIDAAYWRRHAREPVRFGAGIEALWAQGYRVFLEVGPGSALAGMGRAAAPSDGGIWLASLRRGRNDWTQLLSSLAELWTRGVAVDWRAFDRDYPRRPVALPTSPFERTRCWPDPPPLPPAPAARAQSAPRDHPLLGRRLRSALAEVQYEAELAIDTPAYLGDHRVHGVPVLPGTAHLELCLAAAKHALGGQGHEVVDLTLQTALQLPEQGSRTVQVVLSPDGAGAGAGVRIFSLDGATWRLHAEARLVPPAGGRPALPWGDLEEALEHCGEEVPADAFYAGLRARGLEFGPAFRGLERVRRRDGEAVGQLGTVDGIELEPYVAHPAVLDACLQVVAAALGLPDAPAQIDTFMPIALDRLAIRSPVRPGMWSHVRLRPREGAETLAADIRVLDADGTVVAELEGLRFARVAADHLRRNVDHGVERWLYEVQWRPAPAAPPPRLTAGGDSSLAAVELTRMAALAPPEADAERRRYAEMLGDLDGLAAAYVRQALRELGVALRPGEQVSVDGRGEIASVQPRYRRLLRRLLGILGEDGTLEAVEEGWVVRSAPAEDVAERAAVLRARHGDAPEAALVLRCGPELARVLRGAVDPLDLLFSGGSIDLARRLYRSSPAARACAALVQRALTLMVGATPGRPLRVLEVGGGTGGTTAAVLPVLPMERAEYLFTDVSPLFAAQAADEFRGYSFLASQALDIERPPGEQGLAGRSFDVILAANVLHATADLRRTLGHCRELLAPGGLLMMLEVTAPQRWVDLTFGLTEGWWRFEDSDLRAAYPLLPAGRWVELLASAGWAQAAAIPATPVPDAVFGANALILARRPLRQSALGPAASPAGAPEPRPDTWLVLGDRGGVGRALAAELDGRGARCVLIEPGETDPGEPAGRGDSSDGVDPADAGRWTSLVREVSAAGPSWAGIVHLRSLDVPDIHTLADSELNAAQRRVCGSVLGLVQALVGAVGATPPRLWVVTRGSQPLEGDVTPLAVAATPVLGLCRSVALEHPELRCTAVDLDGAPPLEAARALLTVLETGDDEEQVAVRCGIRHVPRLVRRAAGEPAEPAGGREPVRLEVAAGGALDDLVYRPVPRRPPGPDEVEIEVRATGLNFRDVLNALGMRQDRQPMGGECAGTVRRVGSAVTAFQVGDEVVALATGGFGTFVTTAAELVQPRPGHLTAEEAATIPIAFMTAHHCLHQVGRLRAGERVLIHAAAGGVGLAAVQLAQNLGAEIFATAGRPEKRAYLRALGVRHVLDSRTLDFAAEVQARTGGRGVDLVLNSLAGEAIAASLAVLAPGGRFVEIGKKDILDPNGAARLRPDVTYVPVDLEPMLERRVAGAAALLGEVMSRVARRALRPLPRRVFTAAEAGAAFRHMAQARHIGKVVISAPGVGPVRPRNAAPRPLVSADGSYLITGGFGGLGLAVARWLAGKGAGRLVLLGRRGPDAASQAVLEELRRTGAEVLAVAADVCDRSALARVLETVRRAGPPLRGVVHAAGVLADGVLVQQRWSRFERVLAPKVTGAWHLHTLTLEEPLDFFALFSSAASLLGSPGQGNHAAANAFLDGLAHHRRALGLPACSINWGAWAEVGAAAREPVERRIARLGLGTIPPSLGLEALECALAGGDVQLGVLPIEWEQFLGQRAGRHPFLSELAREIRTPSGARRQTDAGPEGAELRRELEAADGPRQVELLAAHVARRAVKVLGLDGAASIDPRRPLRELGLDSLMAVELRNILWHDLDLAEALPATLVFDHPTVEAITRRLADQVLGQAGDRPGGDAAGPGDEVGDPLDRIENLSDDEVDRLLAESMQGER